MSTETFGTAEEAQTPNPFLDALGVRLSRLGRGFAEFELELEPRHLNRSGSLQGGVSATLLDAACGYATLQDESGNIGDAVTLMLSISYLAKVSKGKVRAIAEVTGAGKSIHFCSGKLISDTGEVIATAQGSFKRIR
jgi:uncharacterized protein (TIGR00369 family)